MDQVHTIYAKTENLMDLIPFPPKIMVWVVLPKEVQTVFEENSKQNGQAETSFPELQQGTTNQSIPQPNNTTVD
jgi:hypothetical protein